MKKIKELIAQLKMIFHKHGAGSFANMSCSNESAYMECVKCGYVVIWEREDEK